MSVENSKINFVWLRRDLRLEDNSALFHALASGTHVVPIFIFDTRILNKLADRTDARVNFIHNTLAELRMKLRKLGSDLLVRIGDPIEVWKELVVEFNPHSVSFNEDFEPYALQRDKAVIEILKTLRIPVLHYLDHLIFNPKELLKSDGSPYSIYTPFSKRWKAALTKNKLDPYPTENFFSHLWKGQFDYFPTLGEKGFKVSSVILPPVNLDLQLIRDYHLTRDTPSIRGTSRLGLHLRFGTVSTRRIVSIAIELNEKFLNELIWREFYAMILFHYPNYEVAFKPAYDQIEWMNSTNDFEKWKNGLTGYPLVDAGMRELLTTGFMHNRVRMVTASFLTKHLLVDWRWGEAWFAEKLLDFDLASNNGGWQWAAGCGCDAAPYFRVFNPVLQQIKFDPDFNYVKQWVSEWGTDKYPKPMVDHAMARNRVLEVYKNALK